MTGYDRYPASAPAAAPGLSFYNSLYMREKNARLDDTKRLAAGKQSFHSPSLGVKNTRFYGTK
jgi:hypothetical protein